MPGQDHMETTYVWCSAFRSMSMDKCKRQDLNMCHHWSRLVSTQLNINKFNHMTQQEDALVRKGLTCGAARSSPG